MAQAKTIQLLRSSQVYENLEAAKAALQSSNVMTGRKDGELLLARYNYTKDNVTTIKSLIGVYHAAPDLTDGTPTGVTFIEDLSTAAGTSAALQTEVNAIEASVGLGTNGTKTDFSGAAVTDNVIAASDTLIAAIQKVANAIAGMDKAASAVDGQVVTTVSEVNGVVSETKANVKDLQLGGYSKDTSATGSIGSTDTVNTALSKLENAVASTTVTNADGSIVVTPPTGSATTTDVNVNVDGTTIVKSTGGALKADLTVTKLDASEVTALSDANVKDAYKLIYATDTNRTAIGDVVKIYKDSALQNVYMGHVDDTLSGQDTTTHESSSSTVVPGTGDDALCFVYQLANGNYKLEAVNVQAFLKETEFKDGLTVDTSNHTVSIKIGNGLELGTAAADGNKPVQVKIDSTSESFLTVGANGVKLSGVQSAINTAKATIDAYTVNGKAISTSPVLDGSDIALTGYSKGSSADPVAATDTVNAAISKLENQVDAAMDAATAAHTAVEHATGNTHVTVSASQPDQTTGKVTYTVNETNIADADDLSAEIAARKAVDGQSGDTYTANSGANYISGATSLNNADVQLDTALKTVDDAMLTQINGSNAIDVTTKESKQQTVSLKLDTTTTTGNITSDMLQITSNGLMMKDVWDCGVF